MDRQAIGGLAVAIRDWKGGVVMISHNEEFVGALCPEQWHVEEGRLTHKGHLAVDSGRFEDGAMSGASSPRIGGIASGLASGMTSGKNSAFTSAAPSEASSAVQSETEGSGTGTPKKGGDDDMKFRARKKKKLTRAQMKEREARRRLRHIEWLNSPKGTPKPVDSDDDA